MAIKDLFFEHDAIELHILLLLLKKQSDLAPHRLQINANNVSRYMQQMYGQRSFPDVFSLLFGV